MRTFRSRIVQWRIPVSSLFNSEIHSDSRETRASFVRFIAIGFPQMRVSEAVRTFPAARVEGSTALATYTRAFFDNTFAKMVLAR